ncbi:hypothetical protein HDF09_001025 [Edaphobacter lichenicola]|uniref:Uncharacterized protein n=1 Tax=Tunturiibacter empetritectus TaxID=3069691 RepID=A0A7W8MR15_9BACT|nr:hypothetical protein [Edaphobacter lichenicola]
MGHPALVFKAGEAKFWIPTHRGETAMDGAPGDLYVCEGRRFARGAMPTHAMRLHEWGPRLWFSKQARQSFGFPPIAVRLRWMGHPFVCAMKMGPDLFALFGYAEADEGYGSEGVGAVDGD